MTKGENIMTTQTIIQKLTSRKLWVSLIGVIVGVAMAFGVDGSEYTEIAGLVSGSITAVLSIISYISGEAKIDAAKKQPGANQSANTIANGESEFKTNDGD